MHPVFGLMHVRLQTWFPFSIQVCLNGREWLRRDLDAAGIKYRRYDNSFSWLEDVCAAQHLMNRQLAVCWPALMNELVDQVHPHHRRLFPGRVTGPMGEYYWSVHQSEWASDVMFRSRAELAALYPRLLRHSITHHDGVSVLRFLGRKVRRDGTPRGDFNGEVVSDLIERPEGVRIKHRLNQNSVKMYDKHNTLRFETTINNPRDFKVFRPKEGHPERKFQWQELRKGVADIHRRAMISQASNERFADAQAAAIEDSVPLGKLAEALCQPVVRPGQPCPNGGTGRSQRYRALNPFSTEDHRLLRAIARPEFTINGLRNRDLVRLLYDKPAQTPVDKKRRSAAISRRLALLRAHGLLRKVSKTHRYVVTKQGRQSITALLAAANANPDQLITSAA
jgi:hypothetical protein